MWVHFHNETKIREYKTEDWDELITLIEKDIGAEKGIEKITFKASKSTEECEVDPDLFDEILATPNNSAHGVFNVYFAVKRLVKLPSEAEPRELYCIDFEHFVQQVEEIVGSPVKRITYSAKGPSGKAIEFEVGEDTFTELPGLIFNAYFEDEEEDGEDEDEKKKDNETTYTIQLPGIPHPFVIRGDLYWSDLVAYTRQLAPKDRLDRVVAKSDKGKEVAATEASFNGIDSDTVVFHITFKPRAEVPIVVQLPSKPSPCTLTVGQYADLQEQLEQLEGQPLEAVVFQRADKNGAVVEETLDEDNFDEFVPNRSLIFKPKFKSGSVPKRVFVRMPAYKHPLFLAVTNLDDLMSQLEAIVGEEDGEVTDLTYNEDGKDVEVDGDAFARLGFPNEPLTVHVKEPNIRRIQFDWEDKPRRVFCRDLDRMLAEINDLLPDGKEVAELSYTIAGPHGQQITQPVDEMAFLDAAEDPSLVFNVKVVGSVTAVVHFPDDGRLRSYKAASYADLVKQVETETALLVSHLTSAVEMDGHRTEVILTEDTFDQQMATSCQVYVYFKEVPTLQVLLPDAKEPVPISVPDYADMMVELRKLAGLRAVEKVKYTVTGPKGQKMEMDFTPTNWEDVAEDPQNTVIYVELGPAPKQYCVEFPEGPVTVNASDFEALQKEIRKQAGGRRVSTVLIERMNSQQLTPEAYEQIQDTPDAGLKVVLSPVEEGSWKTVQVKFPFEKEPRQVSGCEYEGIVQELNRLAPDGCLELERLVYYPDNIETDVDAETFNEAYSPNVIFHAFFVPDPKYEIPPRLVSVDGTDQKYPVYAPTFKDFMDFIEEIAAGRPIVSLVPEMEGAAEIAGEEEYDDMAKAFYDLPRDANFRIVLAKGSQAAGARVKFPHSLEELLLEAHTFDRLMHLIKTEARSEGYKVAKVTYFVEGPAGQKMECEDLDEDVFENLEDLDQCVFKVYYEGQPKGSKLVLYPDDDQPHQVLAQTYQDFIEAIMEENPEKPRIELILYEVPAPKGGTVSFPLTEEAWDDVADEANVVFRVIFPLPTTELLVQFPWDDAPKSVPAGSFEELQTSIAKMCPADQKVVKLTYTVEGPSGHKLEFPLNEEAFGDIDDADTVVKVHTIGAKALYVQYPAAPISWQVDFKAFLRDVQASGTPGKKVRSVYVTHPGQAEALLDAARYKELESAEGFSLRVEYE